MSKMKAVFGLWADIQIGAINKLLKPYGVRLVKKTSKDWGAAVSISAHPLAAASAPPAPRAPLPGSPAPGSAEGFAALLQADLRDRFWGLVSGGKSAEVAYNQCRLTAGESS